MNSADEDAQFEITGRVRDEGPSIDPRIAARVSRLLRWYPIDWRQRYGDEFEAVLASSLSDGKGGFRLSLDVAREGVATKLESAGFVGRSAPALERARASVTTVFAAILGFLAAAAALAFYGKGWQRTPVLESIDKASRIFGRSKAYHVMHHTMSDSTYRKLQLAANRSQNGNSAAWKAFERYQTRAMDALQNSPAGRVFQTVVHHTHVASGAPVVFNDIGHVATVVAIALLALALILVTAAAVRDQWQVNRRRLLVPLGFLSTSAAIFVLGAIAYQAFQNIPLGQPGSEWWTVKSLFDGNFRFWPVVVFPLCAAAAIVFAVVGGVKLMRRVDFPPRMYRLQGSLAVAAAGCLGVVLVSTLSWVATLCVQAPEFLTSKDGGVFGTSFLPVFLVAMVIMIGASWLVVAGSARCLRSVRSV